MKNIITLLFVLIFISNGCIPPIKPTSTNCKLCGCPMFRPDSENPDRCINIREANPRSELCQHTEEEHNK